MRSCRGRAGSGWAGPSGRLSHAEDRPGCGGDPVHRRAPRAEGWSGTGP